MENLKAPVEEIVEDIKEYVDVNVELYKLKATEKSAQFASSVVINFSVLLIVCFVLLFASIGLALKLSIYFEEMYIGFLVVSGIYAFAGIILLATKNLWLKSRLVNSFIRSVYSD